ncbi:putative bifunctional diguanylate cyclase/phosphodiesterase [Blastococcus tunisiensis]|uniref:PAS domain S-box-containing protein/diguanylate cyclase (GGDEF) domain-containing protein n=1 Tax=Blastococcus tunisiensis TaxID=1798228 RepID=A0A1I2CTN5_9ACTN|nr:GGDEF domain-containing phosphodiesterase [Blastococcus sp. DSM 46838]SFE71532.1 PAS domain S-box-containing protein/diguanylate cyclase (GGDEF) domain-containing protein [Blastococcus sp. DSM 46838]
MDSRRWWLLAAAVPVALGCALAAARPALHVAGELAVVGAGLIAAVVLWTSAPRTARPRAWRLFAVAPLFPVAGALAAALAGSVHPVQLAVVRWLPTVPGYLVAIIAILALADCRGLRARPRVVVEVALFLFASLIMVSLLVVGPAARWAQLALDERVVLGAAVLITSATMASALTALSAVEPRRRTMAVVLLAGTVLLTTGRGLSTSAMLSWSPVPLGVARFPVAAGLLLLALAVLLDTRPAAGAETPQARRSADLGQLLPHLTLLAAVVSVGAVGMTGERPTRGMIAGLVFCVALAAVHRWLTARAEHRLTRRLRRSEAYFRSVVRSGSDAVVILDDDLRITWASPALDRALGAAAADLVGEPLLRCAHPDDRAGLMSALPVGGSVPSRVPPESGLLTLRLQDAEGEWRCLEAGVSDLRTDPDVGAVVLHCRDMTERHAREQALQAVAYTDPMTGLPNRAGLLRVVQEAMTGPGTDGTTLLMIELDGLAGVRENAGRDAVTASVAEVGRRLRATVRGEDTVARLGGGAFAVLAHGDEADVDRLANRCLFVVEQPIMASAGLVELTSAIGVVPIERDAGLETVLGRADLAVRAAHEAGPGSARRYDTALGEAAARRDRLRHDLQGARARGELHLLFQPIASLGESRITGVEADLRWRHGALGEIPASEFIPLAERAGLIGELVRWSLEAAATAASGLPESGAPLRIGITVPGRYLAGGTLVTDVESALRVSGLAPERLVLQIGAASVVADDERLGLDVASLRLMGVHVALHGFGSGSSALADLTRLPIDIVKLDRSLITRIDRDPQSRALCESVVGIGRALGLDVVAEGVETPAQLAALSTFGCGFAQGFAIARPMSLAGFTGLLGGGDRVVLPGLVGTP